MMWILPRSDTGAATEYARPNGCGVSTERGAPRPRVSLSRSGPQRQRCPRGTKEPLRGARQRSRSLGRRAGKGSSSPRPQGHAHTPIASLIRTPRRALPGVPPAPLIGSASWAPSSKTARRAPHTARRVRRAGSSREPGSGEATTRLEPDPPGKRGLASGPPRCRIGRSVTTPCALTRHGLLSTAWRLKHDWVPTTLRPWSGYRVPAPERVRGVDRERGAAVRTCTCPPSSRGAEHDAPQPPSSPCAAVGARTARNEAPEGKGSPHRSARRGVEALLHHRRAPLRHGTVLFNR